MLGFAQAGQVPERGYSGLVSFRRAGGRWRFCTHGDVGATTGAAPGATGRGKGFCGFLLGVVVVAIEAGSEEEMDGNWEGGIAETDGDGETGYGRVGQGRDSEGWILA